MNFEIFIVTVIRFRSSLTSHASFLTAKSKNTRRIPLFEIRDTRQNDNLQDSFLYVSYLLYCVLATCRTFAGIESLSWCRPDKIPKQFLFSHQFLNANRPI